MRVWLLQRNEPTPHDDAGSQRAMRTGITAKVLASLGHDVVWWTSDYNHYNKTARFGKDHCEAVADGYRVQYLESRAYTRNLSLARIRANRDVARSFLRVAGSRDDVPDVILASIPTAELAEAALSYAEPRNIPVILDVRDLWPDHIVELAPPGLRRIAKIATWPMQLRNMRVFRKATGIYGLTEDFLSWGLAYAGREQHAHDAVFPMGYVSRVRSTDAERAAASVFWDGLGVASHNGPLLVVFIGVVGLSSDFAPIIEAARKLEAASVDVQFVIAGAGEKLAHWKERSKGVAQLLFPGWLNQAQIHELLQRADVGLLPYVNSVNYTKNLPNKPAEYLSGGLGLATSLSEGPIVSLIQKHGCGFSYLSDSGRLAQELKALAESSENRHKMQESALRVFDESLNGEKTYRELVKHLEGVARSVAKMG